MDDWTHLDEIFIIQVQIEDGWKTIDTVDDMQVALFCMKNEMRIRQSPARVVEFVKNYLCLNVVQEVYPYFSRSSYTLVNDFDWKKYGF